MKVAKQTRKRNWTAAAVAIVMVLAVFVAPMCASVCASKSCDVRVASTGAEAGCHHGNGHHSHGIHAANKKACAGQELPAATLNSKNEQALSQQLEVQAATIAISEPTDFSTLANRNAFCSSWLDSPLERNEDSSSTVLRI